MEIRGRQLARGELESRQPSGHWLGAGQFPEETLQRVNEEGVASAGHALLVQLPWPAISTKSMGQMVQACRRRAPCRSRRPGRN